MRVFFRALVIFSIFLLLLLSVGFFLPGRISVSVVRVIDAPAAVVFQELNDLRCFNVWSPWAQLSEDTRYNYGGGVGVGSYMDWTSASRQVGSGRMTIVHSVPYREIRQELRFGRMGDTSEASFLLKEVDDGTALTWTMEGNLGWNPISRWMNKLYIERSIEVMYERGLQNLKDLLKKKTLPAASSSP